MNQKGLVAESVALKIKALINKEVRMPVFIFRGCEVGGIPPQIPIEIPDNFQNKNACLELL